MQSAPGLHLFFERTLRIVRQSFELGALSSVFRCKFRALFLSFDYCLAGHLFRVSCLRAKLIGSCLSRVRISV